MAPRYSIKNKGFTILEAILAILIFSIGLYLLSTSYINIVRGYLNTQKIQISLSNLKLALDKIWKDMKYGIDFNISQNCIIFKRVTDCKEEKICYDVGNKNIFVSIDNNTSTLIDPKVLEITGLYIHSTGSTPNSQQDVSYIQRSEKIITISITANSLLHNKIIPFNFQMSVAPINSVFPNPKCSR